MLFYSMDELLFNPRMMADINGNSKIMTAEVEVKKLQELVRKLERQNEQLRTRANAANNCTSSSRLSSSPSPACIIGPDTASYYAGNCCISPLSTLSFGLGNSEERYPYLHPPSVSDADVDDDGTVLDEVEILNLDVILPCDGESDHNWLYVSPKAKLFPHFLLSPLQWCRHVLDNPRAEVELAKRSLCYKLDQDNVHQPRPLSPQSSIDSELSVSELEEDSISMSYKLQDMTDVEVMARLQEESLRQEYATSAATATHHSGSLSVHTGARRGMRSEIDLEEEEEYDQLSAPQPRLFRTASMQRSTSHTQNLSSMKECRRSPSTPQHLNSLSHQQLHISSHSSSTAEPLIYRGNTDKLRRSMPNLIRAPSVPSVLSGPNVSALTGNIATSYSSLILLRNSQSFDSHNGLIKIHSAIPSPGQLQQRVQSVGNFSMTARPHLKATAYVSPTIQSATTMSSSVSLNCIPSSSIPLPSKPSTTSTTSRSSLPRPASFIGTSSASRSKIAQPVRSLLTPPKSVAALSTLRDGSWRNGCY
ncbi:SLAIN motif-containing protein 1a isoform X7 [Triplophysa rosa]|uniref:SLAIN motif-containing protein 1a isoform X7 n=1 Tax=Triplophysa rosa TaxID=992332 RepID=UPI00254609C6|nr:SLAIN motif-containing protein 1a isoform X7 [Triplophysa rosa]